MKLQILNNIAQQGLDVLQENDFSLSENYADVNGIVQIGRASCRERVCGSV